MIGRHRAVRPHRRRRARGTSGRKVVAITGTNGKSTTTALIGHDPDRRPAATPASAATSASACWACDDMHGGAVYVLEVSSYQLDLTSSLKPDVAILLNICRPTTWTGTATWTAMSPPSGASC